MEEQEKLSQELEKLKKAQRFSAPNEGYFDALTDQVMARIRIEETFGKEERPTIPDGYFDHLPDAVMARIQERSPSGKVVKLYNIRWMAAAAVLILVAVVMLKVILPTNNGAVQKPAFVALSSDFSSDLTSEEIDDLIQSFNSEEDFWLLQQMESVHNSELPEMEGLESDENLMHEILTDEEIEYLNEIM